MTPSLIVVALGAVAAAVATGVLTARCTKTPRIFLVAWTVALFWLAVALASQALGDLAGYSGPMFRAMELGMQALAPLLACLGMAELAARSLPAKFAMRLAVAAIGVIAVVILGSDPLDPNATFGKAFPDPAVFYEPVPKLMIEFLAVFSLIAALGTGAAIMVRSARRSGPADVGQPVLLVAAATFMLALPGLFLAAHITLPAKDVFAVAGAAAAGLIWFGCSSAEHRGLTEAPADRDSGRYQRPESEDALDRSARRYVGSAFDAHDDGFERSGPDTGVSYPGLAALAAEPPGQVDRYADQHRQGDGYDDSGRLDDSGLYDSRGPAEDSGQYDAPRRFDDSGQYDGRYEDSGVWDDGQDARRSEPRGPLFGQITIYTLLDDRVADFDRLTERVVEEVRASEPGTLAYIVHAVPTAPLQRILYEVYQDRPAYDEHQSRPYVAKYEAERRRFVLATNVIELGLQQAKVSPFPTFSAISDLLSESGIDLTGVTKSRRGSGDSHRADEGYGRDGRRSGPADDLDGFGDRDPDGRFGPDGSYSRAGRDDRAGHDGTRASGGYAQPGGFTPSGGLAPDGGFGEDGYTVPAEGRGQARGRGRIDEYDSDPRYAGDAGYRPGGGPDRAHPQDHRYGPAGTRPPADGYLPDAGYEQPDGYAPQDRYGPGADHGPHGSYPPGGSRPPAAGYVPGSSHGLPAGHESTTRRLPAGGFGSAAGQVPPGGYGPPAGQGPAGDYVPDGGRGPAAGDFGPGGGYGPDGGHIPNGGYGPGGSHLPSDPYPADARSDRSVPGPDAMPGPDDRPEEPGYQGWAGLRGDDGGYR